jgi:hypothetical protein
MLETQDGFKQAREIPMRRFLKNLFRDLRKTQSARQTQRRTNLQLEGLEDRKVQSASPIQLGQIGQNLEVFVSQPGKQIEFIGDKHHGQLDVVELGGHKPILLGHFRSASIKNVDLHLDASDTVIVNDSRGYPFASGTTINMSGTGPGNNLTMTGNLALNTEEIYVGGDDLGEGALLMLGTRYNLDSTVSSVTDSLKNTGLFDVQTSSNVSLTGNGVTQTMSGLGINGSAVNNLTFSNKSAVQLEEYAANATITLDATAAAVGEQSFTLLMVHDGEVAFIEATPSTVKTNVTVNGNSSFVDLEANSGAVSIHGNGTTSVALGNTSATEAGIQANVNVQGAKQLVVVDAGNTTTQEKVTVTESSISGTGLFGNNAAVVNYSNVGKLQFLAGEKHEQYFVHGSTPTAAFNNFSNPIEIDGSANGGLFVDASVTASSNLELVAKNASKADNSATLVVFAPGATLNPVKPPFSETGAPVLSGAEAAFFPNGSHSAVVYQDFSTVLGINHIPV